MMGFVVSRATFRAVAESDGWVCWLCGDAVAREAESGPWSGTVDHVRPRRRRGPTVLENLRLAHRSCNTRRGADDPDLQWPDELAVIGSVDLWSEAVRLAARGDGSIVGLVAPAGGEPACGWLVRQVERMVRGRWVATTEQRGDLVAIRLECVEAPAVVPDTRGRAR